MLPSLTVILFNATGLTSDVLTFQDRSQNNGQYFAPVNTFWFSSTSARSSELTAVFVIALTIKNMISCLMFDTNVFIFIFPTLKKTLLLQKLHTCQTFTSEACISPSRRGAALLEGCCRSTEAGAVPSSKRSLPCTHLSSCLPSLHSHTAGWERKEAAGCCPTQRGCKVSCLSTTMWQTWIYSDL